MADAMRIRSGAILLRSIGKRGRSLPWALALMVAPPVLALNPDLAIGQYLHTSWTQEEGSALPPIETLAQTADGYLWLGTANGLIRFDGMRFTEWSPTSGPALPSSNISCLRPASGGGLWVGTAAGACLVDHGRVKRYPAMNQLPCGVIVSVVEDQLGRLWMLNECPAGNTIAVLSPDGSLRTFGTRDGLPARPTALYQDRQGTLWIGTPRTLCRWLPGSDAVCSKDPPLDVFSIGEAPDGRPVIASGSRKQAFRFSNWKVEPIGRRVPDSLFMHGAMLCDRDGNTWIGTTGQGLLRFRDNKVDRFTRAEGLSSNFVSSLLEDREGDIWAATARGLDRFREPKVQLFTTLNGLSGDLIDAVYGAQDGAVWVGTAGGGLDRIDGEQVTHYSAKEGLPDAVVFSLYEDTQQHLWAGTGGGLAFESGGRFVEIRTESGEHLRRVFDIAANRAGTVWAADSALGLFSIRGGVAQPVTVSASDGGDICRLLVARNGAAWLGHFHGGVTVLNDGSVKHYDRRDGLSSGPVRALYEDREGAVWVGTGDGLSRFRDGHWTAWTAAQGLPEGGVRSILEDGAGGLWLMTPTAVLRLSRNNLEARTPKTLAYISYGRTEGLRLARGGDMTYPRLARSRDGRLWVCTEDGVAAIDPTRIRSNPVAPPLVIEQVVADGKAFDTASPEEIAFRGHDLQIIYTGNSLMVPERVRFRYRMLGLDSNWTDAGTRRNVAYVNLPPGHYRFQVIACNNDDVWNTAGSQIALRVDPYFYQTTWFAAACVSAALLLIWFVHWLNMRRVVSRVQLIAAERVRFSRELHDSLLQGFAGVVYLLEAVVHQFDSTPEITRQRLERALDQADQSLREARQMIVNMRIPALDHNTLPEALQTTMAKMMSGAPVLFQFDVKGHARQAPHDVEANLFLIAREGVTNSLNHARATRIWLALSYTREELHLTIEDDGKGFDPKMALAKTGHWGFRGMHERARQIDATFDVKSALGRGTTIDVGVPWKE